MSLPKCLSVLIFLVLLAFALESDMNALRYFRASWVTQGRVAEFDAITHRPVVEFTTRAGQSLAVSMPLPGAARGDAVSVRYLPDAPAVSARINNPVKLWAVPACLSLLALLYLIAGYWHEVITLRRQ